MANILGIEMTPRAVRGALVRTSFGKHEILRYLEVAVEPMGEEGSHEAATKLALEQLIADAGGAVTTVTSMDGSKASLRGLSLPAGAAKHADAVVPGELDQLIPFSIDEAVIDHQPVGTRDGELQLLTVAVPEERVEEELSRLAGYGVDPQQLAVDGACLDGLSTALGEMPEGEVWLLLHVAPDHSELCMLRGGVCEQARTLDVGLDEVRDRPKAIQRALAQSLAKYRADGGAAPGRLIVMGDAADDAPLTAWFGELLELPSEAVSLPAPEGASEPSPRFAKALALSLRMVDRTRRLNLRKGRFAASNQANQLGQYVGLAAACVAAIVVSFIFSTWAQISALEAETESLKDQLEQVSERRFGVATRSARQARSMLEGGTKSGDPLPAFDGLRALAAISDAIATDIEHDARKLEIQLDESGAVGNFELQGSLPDLAARDRVAAALEEHECISELERGKTSSVPGKERKNYTIEGTIACPGAAQANSGKKGKKRRKAKKKKKG